MDDVDRWLDAMYLPKTDAESPRERALAEMQEIGIEIVFPQVVQRLQSKDAETRCCVIGTMVQLDPEKSVPSLLNCLSDPEAIVRAHACACLHDIGDDRAVARLIDVSQNDRDAEVRGIAVTALGRIGSPAAIPSLLVTMDADKELDDRGFTPGLYAAMALDELLCSSATHVKMGKAVCRLPDGEPDLALLRREAETLYERWRNS
jgi:HEAT repeat protein